MEDGKQQDASFEKVEAKETQAETQKSKEKEQA